MASRGFTLVELAIVVVIVGVLSVIAIVGYRRYIQHTKIGEAQANISAIRLAQEDYRAEKGTYLNIGDAFCPTGAGSGNVKYGWNKSCPSAGNQWGALPVHIDGPVLFGYATKASVGPDHDWAAPGNAPGIVWGTPTQKPWYTVTAQCDLDGNAGDHTILAGASFTNVIMAVNEGL